MIDLIRMQAIYWDESNMGTTYEARDIPEDLLADAKAWREKMVEAAAEGDEELLDKFLEDGELSEDEIRRGLRARTLSGDVVVRCAARRSRTRACRRCSTQLSTSCRRPSTCRQLRACR